VVMGEQVVLIGFQAATIDTMQVQIGALKKRGSRKPFTFTLGPSVIYDMAPCGGSTSVQFDDVAVTTSESCNRLAYGIGITGGLDLIWLTETIGKLLRFF